MHLSAAQALDAEGAKGELSAAKKTKELFIVLFLFDSYTHWLFSYSVPWPIKAIS